MKRLLLIIAALFFLGVQSYSERVLMPYAKIQFFSRNGKPLAGGKLYSYVAGTTTPKTTYSSATGAANTNPVILDAAGRAEMVSVFIVVSIACSALAPVLFFQRPNDADDRHLVHQRLLAGVRFRPGGEGDAGILKRGARRIADQAFEGLAVADGVVMLDGGLEKGAAGVDRRGT